MALRPTDQALNLSPGVISIKMRLAPGHGIKDDVYADWGSSDGADQSQFHGLENPAWDARSRKGSLVQSHDLLSPKAGRIKHANI